ncbi:hypothetical protein C2S52_014139 [Perilla frutescens var. hirtella]|nr:hypothetical protein C2S52_014139 [Perilla frutescens var. hirtella]
MVGSNISTEGHACDDYIPGCEKLLKPFVGQKFKSVEDGIIFYRNYGAAAGFDIHHGTARSSNDDIILCEKNSVEDEVGDGVQQKRRRVSKRVNCMARITLKLCGQDGYVVSGFREGHTHLLVTEEFKKYLKVNRKLGVVHQNFILDCARANVWPMRCFRISKEAVGGYSNVGATGGDFKNFSRDMRAYISGCDAQIDDNLSSIFWADPTARRNYSIFDDVVTFDCTYKTNRYEMIFAPFTGKDNHRKIVTFGDSITLA